MTQNSSRNVSTNLQYKVNQQSVQAAIQANNAVALSFNGVKVAANTMSAQFLALNPQLAAMVAQGQAGAVAAQAQAKAQQQVAQAYTQTAQAAQTAAVAQAAATPAQTLNKLAYAGIALPGIGFQSPLVVGLRAASLAADKTGASFLQLGVAGGLLGAAMVGIAVAFNQFNETINSVKQHLTAALVAQDEYYGAVRKLSEKEARERIQQLQFDANVLQRQAKETRDAADESFRLEQGGFGDLAARILNQFGVASSADLAKRADELEQALDGMGQSITRLKQGVNEGAFVFGNYLEAQEALTKAQKDSVDAVNDGLKDIAAAAQAVADAEAQVVEVRQQLIDIDTEATQKSRQLALETAEREREAQTEAEERRQEIAADGAEQREQIERDNAERRQEILDRFNRDYNNAVADRDTLAALKATQTRDDELSKQDKAYQKQIAQLEKQMDKQLAAVDKALNKQLSNIQKQYERQQASIDDAYNKQLRNLTEALNKALAEEQFANQRLEVERGLNAFRAQYWAGVVETANKRMADSAAALAVSLNQSSALISGAPYGTLGGPDNGVYPGAGTGGNNLGGSGAFPPLSDQWGNVIGIGAAGMSNFMAPNFPFLPPIADMPPDTLPDPFPRRRGMNLPGGSGGGGGGTYGGMNLNYAPSISGLDIMQAVRTMDKRLEGYLRQSGVIP